MTGGLKGLSLLPWPRVHLYQGPGVGLKVVLRGLVTPGGWPLFPGHGTTVGASGFWAQQPTRSSENSDTPQAWLPRSIQEGVLPLA
jgi:hypothetical protein